MNWFQHLANFICKAIKKEIPFQVGNNELLVRGILHPMFYSNSNKTVKREAFLPPSNRQDVSLLRHGYSTDNFCKIHASSLVIKDNQYCGLATFCAFHPKEVFDSIIPAERIKVEIKGTPIDENGVYISTPPVYKKSRGLPMHADMLYETPLVKGAPQTKHRQFANKLAKVSNYFHDPKPNSQKWSGEKLKWAKKNDNS
ncbi:MAG TPA: hypothetical protein VGE25_05540 [Sediminibacterium sp.]